MKTQSKLTGRYSVAIVRSNFNVWGWNDLAIPFGVGELRMGPLVLQVTWPVVWPY